MNVRFDEYGWLIAGAVVAAALAVIGLRWFGMMSSVRKWSAVVMRVVQCAVIAALLAGMTLTKKSDGLSVVALIDVSSSVTEFGEIGMSGGERGRERVLGAVRSWLEGASVGMGEDDRLGVIVFDGRATAVVPPMRLRAKIAGEGGRGFDVGMLENVSGMEPTEGTDIAAAVELGVTMLGAEGEEDGGIAAGRGRLVLISDGNQTRGDVLGRVAGFVRGEQRGFGGVDVLPIEYQVRGEVVAESLEAPNSAAAGERVRLRAVLSATQATMGTLTLLDHGVAVDINGARAGMSREVALGAGVNVEVMDVELDDRRLHRFEVVFEPQSEGGVSAGDRVVENNRARAFTVTTGKGNVLILDGVGGGDEGGGGGELARILRSANMVVEMVRPEGFDGDLLSLQTHDAVVLMNVGADALTRGAHEALQAYVREMGGGLVMVGGPESFAPGGWRGTAIEPILPVKLDLPEELVTPTAAVEIVLDKSGSMRFAVMGTSLSQMEIASEGAVQAIASMDRSDLVGVVAFSDDVEEVVLLGRNSDPERTARRVRGIEADGGTIIGPAVTRAGDALAGVKAEEKHLILLSDGRALDADVLVDGVRGLREKGIRVTTIAVGDDADVETLSAMAREGDGKFYRVVDPALVPRVLVKAVRVVRTAQIRREQFVPRVVGRSSAMSELLASEVERAGVEASLEGMVVTRVRTEPGIDYALVTPKGERADRPGGEPVLASWNVGLGKVAAWTSDVHEWGREWTQWEGGRAMWRQLLKQTSRAATPRGLELRTSLEGADLVVRLVASDEKGKPIEGLEVKANVYPPGSEQSAGNGEWRREVMLEPIGVGEYLARLRAEEVGTWIVTVSVRSAAAGKEVGPEAGSGGEIAAALVGGVSRSAGEECRSMRSDRGLLEEAARVTGGRVLSWDDPAGAGLFDRSTWKDVKPSVSRTPMNRMLLWILLGVMLLDVGARRVAWDRFVSREFGGAMGQAVSRLTRDRGAAAARTAAELRARQSRVAASSGERALGEREALELIVQQRARRKAAGQAQPGLEEPQGTGTSERVMGSEEEQKELESQQPSSLQAAKERARKRIAEEEKT